MRYFLQIPLANTYQKSKPKVNEARRNHIAHDNWQRCKILQWRREWNTIWDDSREINVLLRACKETIDGNFNYNVFLCILEDSFKESLEVCHW